MEVSLLAKVNTEFSEFLVCLGDQSEGHELKKRPTLGAGRTHTSGQTFISIVPCGQHRLVSFPYFTSKALE
jgi:hypothetical protein